MLISVGMMLLEKAISQQEHPQSATVSRVEPSEKDKALLTVKNKDGSVTVIIGTRDTGKSELSYRYAQFLGRPVYCVSPQQNPPSWITRIKFEDIEERVPPRATLILDDLPAYASNTDYNDSLVRTLNKIIPMVRHERQPPDFPIGEVHLIFNSQSAAQADRYILDCDIAFFKPLGLLMGAIERPAVAKIYREFVDPHFEGKDDNFVHRHAYMMTRSWRGLIEVARASR